MTDRILLGTTRYEVTIKRDAQTHGIHEMTLRPMNEPELESVTFELPSMGMPGETMKLEQKLLIDLPTYLKAIT